jgi:hypothetical protein
VSLKKSKSQDKAVEETLNSKEENFCMDFVQEIGLRSRVHKQKCEDRTETSCEEVPLRIM